MYDLYARKVAEDDATAAAGDSRALTPPTTLADFVRGAMLHRFGLVTAAESTTFALVEAVQRLARRSPRLRLFGQVTGILEPDSYSPRMSCVFLALLRLAFPAFSAATLRARREGRALIPVERAVTGATLVFVDHNLSMARDKLMLTSGRRAALVAAITNSGEPYSAAVGRIQALDAAAAAERSAGPSYMRPRGAPSGGAGGAGGVDDDDDEVSSPAPSAAGSASDDRDPKVEAGKEYLPTTQVVDADTFFQLCMSTWAAQVAADMAGIRKLYTAYDVDSNGVLSYEEFCALLRACAPSMSDVLTDHNLTELFEEAYAMEHSGTGGPPPAMAAAAASAGDDVDDVLSPDAFACLCDRYGIVPFRKAGLPGATDGDGAASPGTPAGDGAEFAPVRRIGLRAARAPAVGAASGRRSSISSTAASAASAAAAAVAASASAAHTAGTDSEGPTPRPGLVLPGGGGGGGAGGVAVDSAVAPARR